MPSFDYHQSRAHYTSSKVPLVQCGFLAEITILNI